MDYTTIFLIIFSLHNSCLGFVDDTYLPPTGDACPCDGQKKNVIVGMSTIRITKTELLPPIVETKSLPPVTSFITLPVVKETVTVIETIPQAIITTHFNPLPVTIFTSPPMLTILSPYSVTSTEIKEPVTKTKTQEVTKLVPAKPFISTLFVISTVSQEPFMHFISFTPITNTETVPIAINFITSRITVTEALPPVIKTVRFGSTTTVRPDPVTVNRPIVTIHTPAHIDFETVGITHTSVVPPVTKVREHTITKTNDCVSKGYTIVEPTNALHYSTPAVRFTLGSD